MLDKSTFFIYDRNYKHPYPRGGLRLFPIVSRKGEAQMFNSIEEMQKFCYLEKDVFINLFSEDQKKSKSYDCMFLDIDSSDLQKSFVMLIKVLRKLYKVGKIIHYHVLFSGSKGFHVYVPFEDMFLSNYRSAVMGWLKHIGVLEYIDTSAIEPNRVTRVLGSINSKSNRRCVYIGTRSDEDEWELDDIIKYSESDFYTKMLPSKNFWWKNTILELKDFDRESKVYGKSDGIVEGVRSKIFAKPDYYPECMRNLFDEAMSGTDLGHFERLELGKFLLHVTGGNIDLVKKIYSKMSDYNESKTEYNLNYITRRKLKLFGCEKMMIEGICPFTSKIQAEKECPFYPSINKTITKERKNQNIQISSGKIMDY